MNWNTATLYAGETLMLPGWQGYFKWNYFQKESEIKEKNFGLTNKWQRN